MRKYKLSNYYHNFKPSDSCKAIDDDGFEGILWDLWVCNYPYYRDMTKNQIVSEILASASATADEIQDIGIIEDFVKNRFAER